MIAKTNRWVVAGLLAVVCGLMVPAAGAAEVARDAAPSTQEVVAAIKRRAQQILAERRKARALRFSGEASQLVGWESNPANDGFHKGDEYLEHSLYLAWSKKLTPTVNWQGTYSGSFDNYLEYGDGDYTSQTLTPFKLTWQPGRMWRLDGGVDFTYLWYPKAGDSNYREFKPSVGIRQNLWGRWFHGVRYEWFIRDYISKKKRDGLGNETERNRVDTRNRIRYEVGTTWQETLFKVKQEWYWHESNDLRNDFYDAQDYKVMASINRPVTKKLSVNASYAYDLKQYHRRAVSGIHAEARYDDTQTWSVSGAYDLNTTWSITPSFTYVFLNSSDPTGEYVDRTFSTTVTARF